MNNGQHMAVRAIFPAPETGEEKPEFMVSFEKQKPAIASVPNALNFVDIEDNNIELKIHFLIDGKKYIQHVLIE